MLLQPPPCAPRAARRAAAQQAPRAASAAAAAPLPQPRCRGDARAARLPAARAARALRPARRAQRAVPHATDEAVAPSVAISLGDVKVEQVMTGNPITVLPSTPVFEVLEVWRGARARAGAKSAQAPTVVPRFLARHQLRRRARRRRRAARGGRASTATCARRDWRGVAARARQRAAPVALTRAPALCDPRRAAARAPPPPPPARRPAAAGEPQNQRHPGGQL
jgi:hypothetical protein